METMMPINDAFGLRSLGPAFPPLFLFGWLLYPWIANLLILAGGEL